jgi:hypothetical protein
VNHFALVLTENLPLQIVIADSAANTLGNDYPTVDNILNFLTEEDLTHVFSADDLYGQYLTILDRAARPEEIGNFEVYQASNFNAVPPLPNGLTPTALAAETQRVFTTVAVQSGQLPTWWLGSSTNGTARQEHAITATVEIASHDPSPADGPLAFTFSRPAKTLEALDHLVDLAAAEEIWRSASTAAELHLAISLGALAMRRQRVPNASIDQIKLFSIGSRFLESLNDHECRLRQKYSPATYERCIQVVANIGAATSRPMGKPKQTRRPSDGAAAFRTHITEGGLALRLMHWQTATDIEFSNVGVKKALMIESGEIPMRTAIDLTTVL